MLASPLRQLVGFRTADCLAFQAAIKGAQSSSVTEDTAWFVVGISVKTNDSPLSAGGTI